PRLADPRLPVAGREPADRAHHEVPGVLKGNHLPGRVRWGLCRLPGRGAASEVAVPAELIAREPVGARRPLCSDAMEVAAVLAAPLGEGGVVTVGGDHDD